ncbi:hypothetical protein V8C86DRAFT_3034533, partial [Haematococcus lacustris]
MDGDEELGSSFVISVDELGLTGWGGWSSVKEVFESRLPLRNVVVRNKLGRPTHLSSVSAQFLLSSDKRLLRLKQMASSQVAWSRTPYVHLMLVSTADIQDYKAVVKPALRRALADLDREWGGAGQQGVPRPHWLIIFVRPFSADPQDKGVKKVFDTLTSDFAQAAAAATAAAAVAAAAGPTAGDAPRILRLDLPQRLPPGPAGLLGPPAAMAAGGGAGGESGTEQGAQAEVALGEGVRCSLESRQDAFVSQVQRLSPEGGGRASWSFLHYFLVKDHYALMMEAAGMAADALQAGGGAGGGGRGGEERGKAREWRELEAVYLEALARGLLPPGPFCSGQEGEELASLPTVPGRSMKRGLTRSPAPPPFQLRQYLFAGQLRALLRLGRAVEAAATGCAFITDMLRCMRAVGRQQGLPHPLFAEAWAFSASLAVLELLTASCMEPDQQPQPHPAALPAAPPPNGSPAGPPSRQGSVATPLPLEAGREARPGGQGGRGVGGEGPTTPPLGLALCGTLSGAEWGLPAAALTTLARHPGLAHGPLAGHTAGREEGEGSGGRDVLGASAARRFFLLLARLLALARQQLEQQAGEQPHGQGLAAAQHLAGGRNSEEGVGVGLGGPGPAVWPGQGEWAQAQPGLWDYFTQLAPDPCRLPWGGGGGWQGEGHGALTQKQGPPPRTAPGAAPLARVLSSSQLERRHSSGGQGQGQGEGEAEGGAPGPGGGGGAPPLERSSVGAPPRPRSFGQLSGLPGADGDLARSGSVTAGSPDGCWALIP